MTTDPFQIKLDEGDSYIVVMPDGTEFMTGFTAEGGGPDHQAKLRERAMELYAEWGKTQGFELTFEAGATIKGKPFVRVLVDGVEKGQLSPDEMQALGLRAITAGIEAERDAGFIKFMLALDPSMDGKMAAASMLHGLREHRQQAST